MSRRDPLFIDLPDLNRPRVPFAVRFAGLIQALGPAIVILGLFGAFALLARHAPAWIR